MTPDQQAAWDRYSAETGDTRKPFDIFAFGDGPDMADKLLALVLAGTKQATASRFNFYRKAGTRPPAPGDLSLVLDGRGRPACVIETTRVDISPFNTATAEFAFVEGEGDRSLEYWQDVHLSYFHRECAREGNFFSEDEPIVFERFRLIWSLQPLRADLNEES